MEKNPNDLPHVLALVADLHGCGWHRIVCPGMALAKSGRAYVRIVNMAVPVEQLVAAAPTSIIFQRQVEEWQLDYMGKVREALPGVRLLYELDDLLSEVDDENYHESFLGPPEEMDARIAKALGYCDGALCPTQALADWLGRLCPRITPTVLPNLLPELDTPLPAIKARKAGRPLRVGWAGGISHGGDLEQIVPAVEALACDPAFEFVFMGMRPPGLDEALYQFIGGVPAHAFGETWKTVGLDLVLAPVIDTAFNRAKSNLKLVQAGMMGAAVIASPVGIYRECPAVAGWAETPEQWEAEIRAWAKLKVADAVGSRKALRKWAMGYSMKARLGDLAAAWGVPEGKPGLARLPKKAGWVLAGGDPAEVGCIPLGLTTVDMLGRPLAEAYGAARALGYGVVVRRPGTYFSPATLLRMLGDLSEGLGSTSAWSNDGACGAGLFGLGQIAQVTPETGDEISETLAGLGRGTTPLPLPFPVGPLAVLSPRAVQAVGGWPTGGTVESQLVEWGMCAAAAGLGHGLSRGAWATATQQGPALDVNLIQGRGLVIQGLAACMDQPEVKVFRKGAEVAHVARVHRVPVPPGGIVEHLESWSAFCAGPVDAEAKSKSVIRIQVGEHLRVPEAAREAGVDWVRFDYEGAKITDAGLAELEAAGTDADVVYPDWLALFDGGQSAPCFLPAAPDWYYLLGRDWLTPGAIFRLRALEGRPMPQSREEVWKLGLEMIRGGARARHLPRLLAVAPEFKETEGRKAHVESLGYVASPLTEVGFLQVGKKLAGAAPSVSVIIPSLGDPWILRPCLATLARNTGYAGEIERILVVSGDEAGRAKSRERIERIKEAAGVRIVEVPIAPGEGFNFAEACNAGAEAATGEVLLFCNDDVRFSQSGWLERLVAFATEPGVGWVQPRLTKQDGKVQTAGIYAGSGGAAELFKGLPIQEAGYGGLAHLLHAVGGCCAACAAIETGKFRSLGGFDESWPGNFNDVVAGVAARRASLTNLLAPGFDIVHLESISRGRKSSAELIAQLQRDGERLQGEIPESDPTWPEQLELKHGLRRAMVFGGGYDLVRWPQPDGPKVLVVGRNLGEIAQHVRAGKRVFVAVTQGGKLILANPGLVNTQEGFSMEDPKAIQALLGVLGITEVFCCPAIGEETVMPGVARGWLPAGAVPAAAA